MQQLFIVPQVTKDTLLKRMEDPHQAYVMIDPTNREEARHLAQWQLAALQAPPKTAVMGIKKVPKIKITEQGAILWVSGLIEELVQDNDFELINQCISNVPGVVDHAKKAIADFETKNITGILDGIKEIGEIFQAIPSDVDACEQIKPDLERIKAWSAILKDPLKLALTVAGNVRKNYVEILADLSEGITDIEQGKDKEAGELAADILVDAIGPIPKLTKNQVDAIDAVDIDTFANQNKTPEEIMAALKIVNKKQKKAKKVTAIMLI